MGKKVSYSKRNIEQTAFVYFCKFFSQFGRVYKAIEKNTGREVAIKIIPWCEDDDNDKLRHEIQLMKECKSPSIVEFFGSYFNRGELWVRFYIKKGSHIMTISFFNFQIHSHNKIVMEFCDGGSVASLLLKTTEGLPEKQIAVIMRDMLRGLVHLHERRMIHRDIKADNVLLDSKGNSKLGIY